MKLEVGRSEVYVPGMFGSNQLEAAKEYVELISEQLVDVAGPMLQF